MGRKKNREEASTGDWLNTYADMVTLLLTFFVLLYSMSSLDSAKFNMLVSAFASEADSSEKIIILADGHGSVMEATSRGPSEVMDPDVSLEEMMRALQEYIDDNAFTDSVELAMSEGEILIRFTDDMLFQPNSAQIKSEHMQLLDFVGSAIKSVETDAELISINGYTAAIPDDPDYAVSDRILSTDRANAVLMHFEDNVGIESRKLMASGWGKNNPIATNDTEEGRSQNRRVEILISGNNYLSDQLHNMYEKLVD